MAGWVARRQLCRAVPRTARTPIVLFSDLPLREAAFAAGCAAGREDACDELLLETSCVSIYK